MSLTFKLIVLVVFYCRQDLVAECQKADASSS